jgi:cobalt-zinc-cadmium efflux system protein
MNGGFLLGTALVVIVTGAMRLSHPIELPPAPMLFAAGGGLITEFISLGLIWKQSKSDLNVKGALWHIIQTFVGSLLIIVTALVVDFTGFPTDRSDPWHGIWLRACLGELGHFARLDAPVDGRHVA